MIGCLDLVDLWVIKILEKANDPLRAWYVEIKWTEHADHAARTGLFLDCAFGCWLAQQANSDHMERDEKQCNIRAYNLGCRPSYLSPFSRKKAKSKIIFSWSSRRNVVPALTDKSPNYGKFAHKRRRTEVAPLRARYHFPRTSLKRVPRIQNLLIARSTFMSSVHQLSAE